METDAITNINEERGIHDDGSPFGNALINTRRYMDQVICTDEKCPVYGLAFKCYKEIFTTCKTYIRRKKSSKLVEKTREKEF